MSTNNSKYITRYLFDKFTNLYHKIKDRDWSFKAFFNSENGGLEFVYSNADKIHDENITIHGFSFRDLSYLSFVEIEMIFIENDKSYLLTFELDADDEDDEELFDAFVEEVYDSITGSEKYHSTINLIDRYYDWGADAPREGMCHFLKRLIEEGKLVMKGNIAYAA